LNCFEDCGICPQVSCAGSPACSGNGMCNNMGRCTCLNHYTGPDCSQAIVPVAVNVSYVFPSLQITPLYQIDSSDDNANHIQIEFVISILKIQEVSKNGNLISSFNINESIWALSPNGDLSADEEGVITHDYVTQFDNGAILNVKLWEFSEQYSIPFANQILQMQPNSVKMSCTISAWPFVSLTNSLQIVLAPVYVDGDSTEVCQTSTDNSDLNGNLRWFEATVNGVTLYGEFISDAVIDGAVKPVSFRLAPDQYIYATLPFFWTSAEIDPSYSVLLEGGTTSGGCDRITKSGLTKSLTDIIYGVSFGGAGFIAIVIYIIWHVKRDKMKKDNHTKIVGLLTKKSYNTSSEIPMGEITRSSVSITTSFNSNMSDSSL